MMSNCKTHTYACKHVRAQTYASAYTQTFGQNYRKVMLMTRNSKKDIIITQSYTYKKFHQN